MQVHSASGLCDLVSPGERIFLCGSAGEPTAFVDAMLDGTDRTRGWDITTSFVPGINRIAVDRLHPEARLTGLFPHAGSAHAETLPVSYHGFVQALRRGYRIDTLVMQVSPPDGGSNCSLGPLVEFTPELLRSECRMLAVINENMPAIPESASIPLARIDAWCESNAPICEYASGPIDPVSAKIARLAAGLVDDGMTLQVGIGKAPTALFTALADRKRLRLHSGLVTEAVVSLMEAGSLDEEHPIVSTALLGGRPFYEWLRDRTGFRVAGCEQTHDPARLARMDRLIAFNSALEVDLLAQASLEMVGNRVLSACGGSLDFAHAAAHSAGGMSVVILAANGPNGQSRIVPQLAPGTAVTLPRTCVDVVVTEHGVADLRCLSARKRAETLIEIAEPSTREELVAALAGLVI